MRCPLSVSPFLSSTSMGWPWAALSRPSGSCKRYTVNNVVLEQNGKRLCPPLQASCDGSPKFWLNQRAVPYARVLGIRRQTLAAVITARLRDSFYNSRARLWGALVSVSARSAGNHHLSSSSYNTSCEQNSLDFVSKSKEPRHPAMRGFFRATALLSSTLASGFVLPDADALNAIPSDPIIEYCKS